ncbi:hypothetical protein NT2_05_02250 [Caenibius tardaugens NBRC 16725]|uniref:Uncharacterized protein n=2 Tax=Caenibius TaxID=2827482 RepID=U2YL44_9SPHN|nr:hypothetical protein NT2_05_02250 [Caenibius tardaugens NBRC 16725]
MSVKDNALNFLFPLSPATRVCYAPSMVEPEARTSRIAIALGFLAVLAVGGGGFLLGKTFAPPAPQQETPATPVKPAPLPAENPLLARGDLITLANRSADAFANGQPLPLDVRTAVGRRFDILLPFGCDGPSTETREHRAYWTYEEGRSRLRVEAKPAEWTAQDWNLGDAPALKGATLQGIEGFWITRPWSSEGTCAAHPAPPASAPVPTAAAEETPKPASDQNLPANLPGEPEETLAIAQFFTADGAPGIRRSGRPYSIVARIAPDQFNAAQGFRLRLTGRIDRTPTGEPVQCVQRGGADQRPACVIATVLDEVRVENPATSATLATWSATHTAR